MATSLHSMRVQRRAPAADQRCPLPNRNAVATALEQGAQHGLDRGQRLGRGLLPEATLAAGAVTGRRHYGTGP